MLQMKWAESLEIPTSGLHLLIALKGRIAFVAQAARDRVIVTSTHTHARETDLVSRLFSWGGE